MQIDKDWQVVMRGKKVERMKASNAMQKKQNMYD